MIDEKFVGWIASLSDGNEIHEAPTGAGEPSAWQNLIKYTKMTGVRVTMLRLIRGGVTVSTMPAKNLTGLFQGYEITKTFNSGIETHRQGIGSVVGDKVFITWVNDFGNVWQDIRDLSSCIIHTTLRD